MHSLKLAQEKYHVMKPSVKFIVSKDGVSTDPDKVRAMVDITQRDHMGAMRFTVWTDNNPLMYILTKTKLDVCKQRKA